ncbi:PPK2 family polyphosphate kinase [Pseudonocardia acidicola]|uniref:Polyphosphate kinase 2 family protein n=1 Tax=Pseudonocardia acidicola TaxID=2724939 RepID=A0ABX1S7R9_9PSEU|nr:PPK2 family polyphosphate kinase [Pseudonocardia acidicola]NMH96421.1 polyphosphate kinase 2 family protein [Pseudonocardia acidicola]
MAKTARETFRVPGGSRDVPVDLAALDPAGRPIGPKDKSAAEADMVDLDARIDARQEALYAESVGGGQRAVLLVLQGMDTSGKGGVIRHVAGMVNPQGLQIASFTAPTESERAHHFLWRIRKRVPVPGRIGVFDRSHYEDVLVVRVESLVPEQIWRARYEEINAFEAELTEQGVTVLKCMLHISPQEQAERLLARLEDPSKHWKYNPRDVDARARWHDYQAAYAEALRRCDTDDAPWYVVPSDRKWYRNWVIATLLAETLEELDPQFPAGDFDIATERARIVESVIT